MNTTNVVQIIFAVLCTVACTTHSLLHSNNGYFVENGCRVVFGEGTEHGREQ